MSAAGIVYIHTIAVVFYRATSRCKKARHLQGGAESHATCDCFSISEAVQAVVISVFAALSDNVYLHKHAAPTSPRRKSVLSVIE